VRVNQDSGGQANGPTTLAHTTPAASPHDDETRLRMCTPDGGARHRTKSVEEWTRAINHCEFGWELNRRRPVLDDDVSCACRLSACPDVAVRCLATSAAQRKANPSSLRKTTQLKKLLTTPGELGFLMEAHNGLSAKIVEEAGFKAIWGSGLSISAAMGVRDSNEASWTQVRTERSRHCAMESSASGLAVGRTLNCDVISNASL
jgi:hypothetical protein